MYEDVMLSKKIKLDVTDGTYSISLPKGLDEEDLYKSISFILARALITKKSWEIKFKSLDDHVSFNIKKAVE